MRVTHLKGGSWVFGLVLSKSFLGESRSAKQLEYMDFIKKCFKKRLLGLRGHRWVSIFGAYN